MHQLKQADSDSHSEYRVDWKSQRALFNNCCTAAIDGTGASVSKVSGLIQKLGREGGKGDHSRDIEFEEPRVLVHGQNQVRRKCISLVSIIGKIYMVSKHLRVYGALETVKGKTLL